MHNNLIGRPEGVQSQTEQPINSNTHDVCSYVNLPIIDSVALKFVPAGEITIFLHSDGKKYSRITVLCKSPVAQIVCYELTLSTTFVTLSVASYLPTLAVITKALPHGSIPGSLLEKMPSFVFLNSYFQHAHHYILKKIKWYIISF